MRIRTYQEISGDDSLTFEEKIDRIEDAVARRQGEEAAGVYREAVDRCIAWSEEPKRFELKQIADAWEATMPPIREAWRSESYGLHNLRGGSVSSKAFSIDQTLLGGRRACYL